MKHRSSAVGVVLAGGASRRMGRDKARLELDGASLVERAARRLDAVVSEVVIADRGRGLASSYRSVDDGPGRGPAAGLLGAAAARPDRDLLVLACDLPAVPPDLLRALAESVGGEAWVPRWSRGVEPLCALYRPAALAALAAAVEDGHLSLVGWLRDLDRRARFLEGPALASFGSPESLFLNLNTPQDLAKLHPGGSGGPA